MQIMHRRLTLAAALALGLTACAQTDTADETTEETPAAEATESAEAAATDDSAGTLTVPVDEVIATPEVFLDGEIAVTGQVVEEFDDDNAFTLTGDDANGALLVVKEGDVVFEEIDSNDTMLVEGLFVEFDAEAMAEAGAEVSPDDEELADYQGDYVIVASSVEQIDED